MAAAADRPRLLPGHPAADRLIRLDQGRHEVPYDRAHAFFTGGSLALPRTSALLDAPCLACGKAIGGDRAQLVTFLDLTRPTGLPGDLNASTFLVHSWHWPYDMTSLAWHAHARICRRCRRDLRRARP